MNSWEPTSFTAVKISKNLNDHIFEVPRYQRAFVWSAKRKDEFIDTLKRGLPFGTILLYRDDTKNQYQIIDGYQRCTTIREFINHPAPFFSEDDIEETVPHQLAKLTDVVNSAAITINVTNHLVDWVHSAYQSMDDVRDMQYIDYAYAFTAFYPSAQGREQEIAKVVKPTLQQFNEFKVNSKDKVGPLHTEFQIVSLIANIFVARYAKYEKDDNDRIINFTLALQGSNPSWHEYETSLKNSAWKRYCLDILRCGAFSNKKVNEKPFRTI